MAIPSSPLTRLLRDPSAAAAFQVSDWELLLRHARAEALTGSVAALLDSAGQGSAPPPAARRQLAWGATLAGKHEQDMRYEIARIRRALAGFKASVVFLKGAAYLLMGLPNARGRIFSDVDLLTPRSALKDAEKALVLAGWLPQKTDPYDQRYYREWMHEAPPLRHVRRGTVVDLHHAILPPTARPRIDMERLLADAREAPGADGALVLAPVDLTLHAIAHAFYDGFFEHGLRDLWDVTSLLRHFSATEERFWTELVDRAIQLDLGRTLWHALRYAKLALGAPVPDSAVDALRAQAPSPPVQLLMDWMVLRATAPNHPSCGGVDVRLSRLSLYIRSHYLRMPLRLLLPHLARKAIRGVLPEQAKPVA